MTSEISLFLLDESKRSNGIPTCEGKLELTNSIATHHTLLKWNLSFPTGSDSQKFHSCGRFL